MGSRKGVDFMEGVRRVMLAPVLRHFIDRARAERRELPMDAPERQFYLGVEAAAEGMLHPEMIAHRSSDWLEREKPEYRDGYLAALADLTIVITAETPPAAVPLPVYPRKTVSP
jgi:hypothetical protein